MQLPERIKVETLRDPELTAWLIDQLGIGPAVAGLLRGHKPDAPLPGSEVDAGRERLAALRQRQIDDLDTIPEGEPGRMTGGTRLTGPIWNGHGS